MDWGYSQYFEIAAGNLKPFLARTLFTEILCKHFSDVMSAPVKRLSSKLEALKRGYFHARWAQIISDALDILKFDGAVQDTLAELRGKWAHRSRRCWMERFDAIGIQYMKLPHEKGAAALGQELSAFGWALYNLDDEDEYLFALIPEENATNGTLLQKAGAILPPDETARAKMGDHAKSRTLES